MMPATTTIPSTTVPTVAGPVSRSWAYAGAILGGAVSVAANVAHSYVPPADAASGWQPPAGAVIGAVFWPVALFIAVEILARTAWPAGRRWVVLRYLGLLPVSLVAAVVSYRHLSGLLAFYGEDGLTATIGPLAVDGLMVMATGALIAAAARRAGQPTTALAPASRPHLANDTSTAEPAGTDNAVPAALPAEPAQRRTGTPARARTGTRTAGRTATRAGTRTDAELTAALADVPRDADGTVPVRRAAAALACGPDRARRLLAAQGLLRTPPSQPPSQPSQPSPPAPPLAA